MKKILVALAALMVLGAGTASATFWTGSISDGAGNWADNVRTLDWEQSGSAVATGLAAPGAFFIGNTFDFHAQARLGGLNNPTGQSVALPGLNTTFEYTLVASFTEQIVDLSTSVAGRTTATFQLVSPGAWYILHSAANSNTALGTNFQDGTIVAQGTWVTGQFSEFTVNPAGTEGNGSSIIEGLRAVGTVVDPNFLDPTLWGAEQLISGLRFETQLNFPANDSTTAEFFAGPGGLLPTYTVQPGDFLFKADGSNKFHVVPEPSTIILLGAGLLGLVGFSRKKMQK